MVSNQSPPWVCVQPAQHRCCLNMEPVFYPDIPTTTPQGHLAIKLWAPISAHPPHSPPPPNIHADLFFYSVFKYNAHKSENYICSLTSNAFITNVSVTSNNTETSYDHAVLFQHVAGALFK